ncbi:MAG: hypothetical protein NTZ48_00430 [Candidatus Omnitrophica bacterium]|nr:hypothetical protein [Candidatus Omnitrophota bacterium]
MESKFKLLIVPLALVVGLFLFLVTTTCQAGDNSDSYYVPKYKDDGVYTYDPNKTKPQYQLGQPSLPDTLTERVSQPGKEWSRPEELGQEFYKPPTEVFGPFTFMKEEEKIEIETRKGNLTTEAFAEELVPIIEAVTGKKPKLGLRTEEESAAALASPVVPVEGEEEKEGENPPQDKKKDEWELLFKKGRVNLKAPSGTSEEDLTAIASSLADLLGRGGEVSLTPEGIEIRLK